MALTSVSHVFSIHMVSVLARCSPPVFSLLSTSYLGPRSTWSFHLRFAYFSLTCFLTLISVVNPFDGRVVSNFIVQALKGEDMTVYGDGKQTRSFQFIHDLIDGLIALMNSDETRPVNIGNGDEFTIGQFAELVRDIVEKVQKEDGEETKRVNIVYKPMPTDDPQKRRPDTSRAKEVLDWQPRWTVRMGLEEMVRYYKAKMAEGGI